MDNIDFKKLVMDTDNPFNEGDVVTPVAKTPSLRVGELYTVVGHDDKLYDCDPNTYVFVKCHKTGLVDGAYYHSKFKLFPQAKTKLAELF